MTSRIDYNNPGQHGNFCLSYHYEMLSDQSRVKPFKKAIQKLTQAKRVFESGTGSGIMAILSAVNGAKKVYCTERDPKMAAIAEQNIKHKKLSQTITLLAGKDSLDVRIKDVDHNPVDVLIAENLSTWLVTEPQVHIMNHLLKTIAHKHTVSIPASVENKFQMVFAMFDFENCVTLKTHYFLFSGIKEPKPLSDTHLFYAHDFNHESPTEFDHNILFKATTTGITNAVKLTSPVTLAKGIQFTSSDSLMPPVVVPLKNPVSVKKGQSYLFRAQYKTQSSWDCVVAEVLPVSG